MRFLLVLHGAGQGAAVEGNYSDLDVADEIARIHKTHLDLSNSQDHATSLRNLRVRLTMQLENPHLTA